MRVDKAATEKKTTSSNQPTVEIEVERPIVESNPIVSSINFAGGCDIGGNIEVEGTGGTNAGYATLQLAFAAINAGTHTGTITVEVCGNTTETATSVLNASGSGAASYTTIAVYPTGGAARSISGAIAAGTPLLDLNGADNVTINGLNTGGNSLTLSNTSTGSTAGTSTIRFIADSTNNTVTNSTILGSSTSTSATLAGTVVFATATTTGNDNNTISNNNIGPAGINLPSKAIHAGGTSSAIENDGNQITGNNIFDYFLGTSNHHGINVVTGTEGLTISNNRFYETAARVVTTAAVRHSAITFNNTTGSFTASGNTIGFSSSAGTGTYTISGTSNEFRGIEVVANNTLAPSSIQGNTITAINQTTTRSSTGTSNAGFTAIQSGTTSVDAPANIGNITGNTIGSLDGSSTIVINATSTTASTTPAIMIGDWNFQSGLSISNNNIGSITIANGGSGTTVGFRGIFVSATTGVIRTINNNTIGGPAAGSITDSIVGAYAMYGIQLISASVSASGNTIRNISGGSTAPASIVSSGIITSGSTLANTVSQNTIHSLANASGAVGNSIYGMSFALPTAANVVERNFIHSLSLTTTLTGSQIWGISGGATGTTTYRNNMIRLGIDAAGNSVTLPSSIIGLRDAAGSTNQFYHNTIYIGGTGVLAVPTPANSYAFFSDVVTVTRAHQNNIFWNARSNAVGGGVAHVATREGGTTANPAGLTSNYNVLFTSGTDGATGVFNAVVVPTIAAWRTATGQDVNSFANDPMLINPTGTAAAVDLHINPAATTVVEANGTLVASVTNDFDNQTRSTLTPVDIGADAGNFLGIDLAAPTIVYAVLGNTVSTANRLLTVNITDLTGVDSGANSPRVYFRKSTDASYVSTQCNQTSGTPQNGIYDCTIDNTLVGGGGVTAGDSVQYFVVAQDTVGNLGSNPSGASGANVNTVTFAGVPNSYSILTPISGNKTVGIGGDYATLTAALAAINSSQIAGPVTLTLTDPTYPSETFPLVINSNSGSSSTNTLTIKPAVGISPVITGSSASCTLVLSGADWVRLDGSNTVGGTSRDLTIINTSTSTTTGVVCVMSTGVNLGATNNVIMNANVAGVTTTATAATQFGIFSGSTTIGNASAGADNDFNAYINNSITKTTYGIYSGGASALNKNISTFINQNVMSAPSPNNITTGGILVNFEDGVEISQNDIGVLKHDGTTGTTNTAFGIALGVIPNNTVTTFTGNDVTNATIVRNRISRVTQLSATGYSTFGIVINSVTSGVTSILNNMVGGVISPSTASDFSAGILAGGGTGSTTQIYNNTVSMTGARGAGAAYPSYSLAINSGNPQVDARNNILSNTQSGGTGKVYAIANAATAFTNMTSNYNDLYVSGGTSFIGQTGGLGIAGTDRSTLLAWQTATGLDADSTNVLPIFASATDLHLGNPFQTGIVASGTPIAAVTVDHDGDPRPASNPEIGADEIVQAESGVISGGSYYNAELAEGTSLSGSVSVSNIVYLTGESNTGANTLSLGCNAVFAGAGGGNYVVGKVAKQFCSTGVFTFPVGTVSDASVMGTPPEYTPMTTTINAGSVFPSTLTVNAVDSTLPGLLPSTAVSRYWTVLETGDLNVDMEFTYLDAPFDVNGNEANYKVFRRSGASTTQVTPFSVNNAANTATVTGVTSFSDWGIGDFAPSAAGASVSGRVTTADGRGIVNAVMVISGNSLPQPVRVRSSSFGYFTFENLDSGETYVVTINSKRFTFTMPSRVVTVNDNVVDLDFVAEQ